MKELMKQSTEVENVIQEYIDLLSQHIDNNEIADKNGAEDQKKYSRERQDAYIDKNTLLGENENETIAEAKERLNQVKETYEQKIEEFNEYVKTLDEEIEDMEEVVEETEVSPESNTAEQVKEQKAKVKKSPLKTIVRTILIAGSLVTIFGVGACVGSKCNNEPVEENTEDETNTTTVGDIIVDNEEIKVVVEPSVTSDVNYLEENEVDMDTLIAQAVEEFDGGELNITKEEYKFMLDYFNNNLKKEVSVDDVVDSAINPVINADVNKNMKIINAMNGVDDPGLNTGNYKASNLILRDVETKKKLEELEILEEAMHSEDPQVQKDAAAMIYRIEWEINYQVNSSHDDLYINGEAFNGYEYINEVFTKDYNSEFYQSDSAASNVLYLTKLLALNPFAHAILGDDFKISEKAIIADEEGSYEIEHSKTIEEIEYDLNVRNCENDDLTLLAKYVDMSVKESNQSLGYEGAYILSK